MGIEFPFSIALKLEAQAGEIERGRGAGREGDTFLRMFCVFRRTSPAAQLSLPLFLSVPPFRSTIEKLSPFLLRVCLGGWGPHIGALGEK